MSAKTINGNSMNDNPAHGAAAPGAEGTPLAGRGRARCWSPRPVTRGETPPQKHCDTDGSDKAVGKVSIDWLNCTFPGLEEATPLQFVMELGARIRRPITSILGRGLFGFDHGLKLYCKAGSLDFQLGTLCYGGESQRGRWMLQIPGSGCKLVRDWPALTEFLESLDAKVTRVDLAMDFLKGEYTVDDAVEMYQSGRFNGNGRPPSSSLAGDWLENVAGRTLYVGKSANGKMLRVYEKGRQMGDLKSPWVRFECQLGNRDRVIPWRVLRTPAAFLAGAYPALADMIDEAAERITTEQKAEAVTLASLMFHLKRAYGKAIDTVMTYTDADAMDLIESVRVVGRPSRVSPTAVDGGLIWERVSPNFQPYREAA